ncbi:hypothetical protein QE152_g12784 [Popillia japonica]|uniref:Secreted protein n=1 Tax=Popillia japonica TaxID=7064 RepID=A0AAW1LN57_POPJA
MELVLFIFTRCSQDLVMGVQVKQIHLLGKLLSTVILLFDSVSTCLCFDSRRRTVKAVEVFVFNRKEKSHMNNAKSLWKQFS